MLLLLLMLLLRRHLSQLVGREVARLLARSGLGEAAEQIRLQQVGQRVVWVGGCVYARFEAQTSLGIWRGVAGVRHRRGRRRGELGNSEWGSVVAPEGGRLARWERSVVRNQVGAAWGAVGRSPSAIPSTDC